MSISDQNRLLYFPTFNIFSDSPGLNPYSHQMKNVIFTRNYSKKAPVHIPSWGLQEHLLREADWVHSYTWIKNQFHLFTLDYPSLLSLAIDLFVTEILQAVSSELSVVC